MMAFLGVSCVSDDVWLGWGGLYCLIFGFRVDGSD